MKFSKFASLALIVAVAGKGMLSGADARDSAKGQPDTKSTQENSEKPRDSKPNEKARGQPQSKQDSADSSQPSNAVRGPQGKVTINHKGRIITINGNALQAHLDHGDTIVSIEPATTATRSNTSPVKDEPQDHNKGKDRAKQ